MSDLRLLRGVRAANGPFPKPDLTAQYQLEGFYEPENAKPKKERLRLGDELLTKGLLFLGSAGTGKTNAILRLSGQILTQMTDDDAAIFFDVKRDYYEAFYEPDDYVLDAVEGTDLWNVFEDILACQGDPNRMEMKIREICGYLFYGRSSSHEPYFVNAAREITEHILQYFLYQAEETGDDRHLNNQALKEFIIGLRCKSGEDSYDEYRRVMEMYEQFRGALTYLPPKEFNDRSAYAVISEITSMANDMLAGNFGRKRLDKDRYVSASNYMRDPRARVLFMEFNPSLAKSQAHVFRYFLDWIIALCGEPSGRKGRTYLFLDELAVLPELEYLDRALNLLRSKNVCIVAGLQNTQQMFVGYPREKALTVLDGFQSIVAFRCGGESVRYLQQRFGNALVQRIYTEQGGRMTLGTPERIPAVEEYEVQGLKRGDAFVALAEEAPFRFHFSRYEFD